MAGLFCKENDMRFNWLRLFYVYGNGQRETSLIPSVIRALENNQQPSIRNYKNRNDFVYVSDVAKAIYSILQRKPKTEILNVGSGYSLSVSDVIRTVAEVLNKNISFEEKQENEIVDFYADPDEMMKAYDWKPSYSLKEALEEMINEGSTVSRW
jgi:nucleoside-diphosphate-sugar epimerase